MKRPVSPFRTSVYPSLITHRSVDVLFNAFSECQALHPDPNDEDSLDEGAVFPRYFQRSLDEFRRPFTVARRVLHGRQYRRIGRPTVSGSSGSRDVFFFCTLLIFLRYMRDV